jgi:chromosome segregation ATPase
VVGFDAEGNRLPPDQVDQAARKVFQRRLRDYALEFDELSRRRLELRVDIDAAKQDLERLTAANESAQKLRAFREEEIQKLNHDLAGITKERQAIERHLALLQQDLTNTRAKLVETLRRNSETARRLAARRQASSLGIASPATAARRLALSRVN